MGVTITKRGQPPRFNGDGVARLIKGLVPGEILRRTDKGIGSDGKPFAPYSPRYRKHLAELGEDPKVDLRVSGGLMNSIKPRSATIGADYVEVVIAPDTGTSPVWRPVTTSNEIRKTFTGRGRGAFGEMGGYSGPLRRGDDRRLTQRLRRAGTMERTGKQGPPHNVVGYWLHYGTPKMRARPFMGLTSEQMGRLWQMIGKILWK